MNKNLFSAKDYIDEQIFKLEQQNIFSDTWHFCGLVEDLAEPNDYMTVQAGNNNLIVYRNEQGELKALHNICRHRGMQLLEGKGKLSKTISCPYHDWTYNHDGELKSLPKAKQDFIGINKKCLSLKQAQAGIWRGMIWVHPNINTAPLSEYFAPMNQHIAPYEVESLIDKVCEDLSLNEDHYGNILIAVTEAVNNAIVHGNSSEEDKVVKVDVVNNDAAVVFSVVDQGEGFDYENLPDPTAPENIEKPDGRGIFLMKNLSDEVEFDLNGSKVSITFAMNG